MKRYHKAKGISWTMMDNHLVILDTRTERKFHEFDEVASFLWNHIEDDGVTEFDLINSLLNEYEVDENQAKLDIFNFISELKDKRLLNE